MPREIFQRELNHLGEEVVELGQEVESCLGTMAEALEKHDDETARQELGIDSRYKERGVEIDEECMILQARQAPVASDLRLIYTVQAVTNHLVRAGTLCEHICRAIVETAGCDRDPDLEATLSEMAHAARNLEAADDKIDLFYSEAMNLAVNPGKGEAGDPEWRVRAALTVHYLERIADHGVDIGRRTVFLVTGERMESAMSQYRNRQLDGYEE